MKYLSLILCTAVLLVSASLIGKEISGKHTVDAAKCVGCKVCIEACPTKAITMQNNKAVIDPAKCVNCGVCVAKCPTKAINPPDDLKKKRVNKTQGKQIQNEPKIIYSVIPGECVGCKECIPVCPTHAISIHNKKAVIDPGKCVNCALCVKSCAFSALVQKEI